MRHREHQLYSHLNYFLARSDLMLPNKVIQQIHPCKLFQAFFLILDFSFFEQGILVFRKEIFSKLVYFELKSKIQEIGK